MFNEPVLSFLQLRETIANLEGYMSQTGGGVGRIWGVLTDLQQSHIVVIVEHREEHHLILKLADLFEAKDIAIERHRTGQTTNLQHHMSQTMHTHLSSLHPTGPTYSRAIFGIFASIRQPGDWNS